MPNEIQNPKNMIETQNSKFKTQNQKSKFKTELKHLSNEIQNPND